MIRPARAVAIAILMVAVSFAISLAYSHFRLQPVSQQALAVVKLTAGAEHLSAVRTELTRLGMYVSDYVARTGDGRMTSRAEISDSHRQLTVALGAYRALPDLPGETELLTELDSDLALLDESTRSALDESEAGHLTAAKRVLHEAFHPRLHKASEDVGKLKTLNAKYANAAAESTLHAKGDAMSIATALGSTSPAVAIVATVLVLQLLRGRAQPMNAHVQLLAARATELEAFAGRVTHDLKNPLGAVALQVLAAGSGRGLDPELLDQLEEVSRQVERMDQIIAGPLEFARAGANPSKGARADPGHILNEVISEVRLAAEAVNAELRVDPLPSTRLACTRGALTSVLSNLLGNAVKYILEGMDVPRRIIVRVRDRGDTTTTEIEDNGPGLPPDTWSNASSSRSTDSPTRSSRPSGSASRQSRRSWRRTRGASAWTPSRKGKHLLVRLAEGAWRLPRCQGTVRRLRRDIRERALDRRLSRGGVAAGRRRCACYLS